MHLKAGDLVEIRSIEEILGTLDPRGRLDNLPFMPEMTEFCGRRFRVQAVAHKTCDTVTNAGARRMRDTVHLQELRCDGSAHGGCQAACLLFWKAGWLKPVPDDRTAQVSKVSHDSSARVPCTRAGIESSTIAGRNAQGVPIYSCQATSLPEASEPLPWWSPRQYVQDVRSGNVTLGRAARVLLLSWFRTLADTGIAYRLARRLYDRVHRWLTGQAAPFVAGRVDAGDVTPTELLDLRAGEWVRIRPVHEIEKTLNASSKNRGLWFDEEMVQHCEKTFRVASRVERIINERTGEMMVFKNPCIVLDGAFCTATYTRLRLLCPRRIISYWREIWLERAPQAARLGAGKKSISPRGEQ